MKKQLYLLDMMMKNNKIYIDTSEFVEEEEEKKLYPDNWNLSTSKPVNGTTYTNNNSSKPVSGNNNNKNPNRPVNGTIITNRYPEGPIDLTVENYSDNDYYVRLIDKNNIEAMSFYIYGDSTINIKAPVGTYSVVYSTGKTWFDENKLFGDSTKTFIAKEKSSLPYLEPKQIIRLY